MIDPVLEYSTYLGGSSEDSADGIAVDAAGNAYVVGYTSSTDFPTAGPSSALKGTRDVFVAKLDAAGSAPICSEYLGGSGTDPSYVVSDVGHAVAVDAAGNIYVTGTTASPDFPVTPGAFQTALAGNEDAFVTKISASCSSLDYSTFLGGNEISAPPYAGDGGEGIAVDSAGNAYVTGYTDSPDFPTKNALQASWAGGIHAAFVTKLNATGSALVYSTYLAGTGGSNWGYGIAVDNAGNAYATGYTDSTDFPTRNAFQASIASRFSDAFVTKLDASGATLSYSTYLGGTYDEQGYAIAVDSSGNAYVTGYTASRDFPTQNAFQASSPGPWDAFVAKLDASGTALGYSTYLGGTAYERGWGIAVDSLGNAYVAGSTESSDFPSQNAIQASNAGGSEVFITKLGATGTRLSYSTYLGGVFGDYGGGIAVDTAGNAYVTGVTYSPDFPTQDSFQTSYAGLPDAFITKISPMDAGFQVAPSEVAFTNQLVSTASATQSVTISNGTSTSMGADITITGPHASDFSPTSHCGNGLAAFSECTVDLTFTPGGSGNRTGTLELRTGFATYTVALSGTGAEFAVGVPSGGSATATVTAGGTATYNMQLAPAGFTGTVALACAFKDLTPRGAACSVSPTSLNLDGTNPASFTLRVTTAARSSAAPFGHVLPPTASPRLVWPLILGLLMLAALAALGGDPWSPGHRRATVAAAFSPPNSPVGTPALQGAPLGATLLFILLWAACGGGGGGGGTTTTTQAPQTGTPAGTYTLTVTGNVGNVTRTTTTTLTVN